MTNDINNKLKEGAIKLLLKTPERKMVTTGSSYTFEQLAEFVKNDDPVGLQLLVDLQMLTLDKLSRSNKPKRNEIDLETITGVRKDWFTPEQYFVVKGRKDKCPVCKTNLREEAKINIVFSKVSTNYAVCKACSDDLIARGAIDILKQQQDHDMEKNQLIEDIMANSSGGYFTDSSKKNSWNSGKYLPDMTIDRLKIIRTAQIAEKNRQDEIERRIQEEYVETPLEQYLIDEYGCYEDSEYLKHELQIEEHFKSGFSDEFDCGQGYYEDEIVKLVKIGNKFYNVTITAEIGSAKQDYGDRLYWIESIEKVTYVEVDKPQPKDYQVHQYSFSLNTDQKVVLDAFIKANKFRQL